MKPMHQMQEQTYVVYRVYSADPEANFPYSAGLTLKKYFEAPDFFRIQMLEPGERIEFAYEITAATSEEASAIFNLREYGTPYYPIGKSETCPKCETYEFFPLGSGECCLCGKIC